MGDRQRFLKSRGSVRFYSFIVVAFLAFLGAIILGMSILGINLLGTEGPVGRVLAPATPDSAEQAQQAERDDAAYVARAKQAAAAQAAKNAVTAERHASERRAKAQAENKPVPTPVVPTDTTMYLTIPALGLTDIPVMEGTSEAVLSQGVGHVSGTGFPWVAGSNTYIAGHRLGYPGTISDHVFWQLPSLGIGDEVILEDTLGQKYTYRVSNIAEVSPSDLSVTGSTGRDIVSLQTCIENYGDYWTAGPNWFVRYIVRADRVS
jgi:LPXTG-site transpeptidase (sortase) family protein